MQGVVTLGRRLAYEPQFKDDDQGRQSPHLISTNRKYFHKYKTNTR